MLTRAVKKLTPSATLAITARAKQMAAEGDWVISFAAGQPGFDTPTIVKNPAKTALDQGFTKYTPSSGIPELKEAIVRKLKRDNKLRYIPGQVIVANGAKQALFEAIMALAEAGDEVVIPTPYWVSYPEMVKASGAKPVIVNTGSDFRLTPERLARVLNGKSRALIVNAPSNPTGVMYDRRELADLSRVALRYKKLRVISDECYDQFYYGKGAQVSFAALSREAYRRTITVNSLSKSFSMTGWRIGYAAGDEKVIAAMGALQSHLTANPTSFAQKGAVVALEKAGAFTKKMRREFARRRLMMVAGLNKIAGLKASLPDGAFYVMADVSQLTKSSLDFAEKLLAKQKVAVIPGAPFGAEGYIRLSFACSLGDIKEGLKRLTKFIEKEYGS